MPLNVMIRIRPSLNRGSGMIEVMVGLFILAIGLLGVLSLQVNGIKSNNRAFMATQAQLLAGEMADRILAYDDIDDADDDDDYDDIDTESDNGSDACLPACDKAGQLQNDIFQWRDALTTQLPGGRGLITINDEGAYVITVMWDNEQTGANGTDCSGNPDVDLTCFTTELTL